MRAANALSEYIKAKEPESVVLIEDTLQYISPTLNKAITEGYVYLATKTPKLFGSMYYSSDKDSQINTLRKTFEIATTTVSSSLKPLIDEFRPDIVVSTHPFASEIFASLRKRENIHIPIISIVTDFGVHKNYINESIEAYIVSSEEMADNMVERGVSRNKIHVYGIPVKQSFYKSDETKENLKEEGLDPGLPTILIMAGSFGVTDVLKIYHKIVKSNAEFQIIVITGKNERLYETFYRYLSKITLNNTLVEIDQESRPITSSHISRHIKPAKPTKLMYYTDEVEKYMHMADLIVTKPGGLTVTESIASVLPMGLFKAIPGQEEQNASYLVRNRMAVRLEKNNTCTRTITDLISHPEKLAAMKNAIKRNSNGNSSEQIYELMKKLVK